MCSQSKGIGSANISASMCGKIRTFRQPIDFLQWLPESRGTNISRAQESCRDELDSRPVLYCDCRASAGWTAAARCAGIQLAMNATTRRAAGVALSVTRSVGLTP